LVQTGNGSLLAGYLYEEILPDPGTETLATWAESWLEGTPAVTQRRLGLGRAIYVGTYLTPDLADWLLDSILAQAGVTPLLPDVPAGVEIAVRQTADREIWFIQNTTRRDLSMPNTPSGTDPVTGLARSGGPLTLGPFGCVQILRPRATAPQER
jgi:beta-galactosidase